MRGIPGGGSLFHERVTLSCPREFSSLSSQCIQQLFLLKPTQVFIKHFEWIPNHVHNQALVYYANC